MTYTEWQHREHIRELQEYLRVLALVDSSYNELAVDGIFGNETTDAVRQYQVVNNLTATGRVDTDLWERLFKEYSDAFTLVSSAMALRVFPEPQFLLRPGNHGNGIVILQAVLNTLTANSSTPPLAITGQYDSATASRVRALQQQGGFPETGEVDRYFWDFLALWYNGDLSH